MSAVPGAGGSTRLQYETLAPQFEVRIDGAPLPEAAQADLTAVGVIEDVDATGTGTFTLLGWDGAQMKVKWIDDELFQPGRAVEIRLGYRDAVEPLFDGEITALEPEFGQGQAPTFTVRAHDRRHRLMRGRRSRSFLDMRDGDIAEQVAADHGLSARVDDTGEAVRYVLQHNQTDLEFLQQRAARLGFEVLVRGRELHFRRRRIEGSEVLTLRRELELLEFLPRLTTLPVAPSLAARGWDPQRKEAVAASAAAGEEPTLMGGSVSGPSAARRAFGQASETIVELPLRTQAEAQRLAERRFGEMALRHVSAEGLCIGEPRLRAGQLVRVEGIGTRFGGLYYVTWTEHRFMPHIGYRTAFSARRNASS